MFRPPRALLLAFLVASCANRGMMAPDDEDGGPSGMAGTAGSTARGGAGGSVGGAGGGGTGGNVPGGAGGGGTGGSAGGGGAGASGSRGGTGGSAGAGGGAGTGGSAGTGGAVGTGGRGGSAGTGGTAGAGGTGPGGGGSGGSAGTGGSGGSAGTGGSAGGAGTGGSGGSAGSAGTGGSGGSAGTGGSAGGAGTGGSAGTGGDAETTGGRGGSGGTGGSAGTGGTAGASGGRGGAGGVAGTGGGAGMYQCPLGGVLDCSASGALTLASDGQVVDFSPAEWPTGATKWCNVHGLDGSVFQYAGTGSTSMVAVDATNRNLRLSFTVTAGQYAGGGLLFDSCVNAAAFNAVQFTAAIPTGSLNGCTLQVQVQTQDQRPTTATNPSGGTCAAATCYQYPAYQIATAPPTAGTTITAPFTSFNNPGGSTIMTRTQIVGLQWQANSASGTGTCNFELRIDDIEFVAP